jgi:membrane-associated phospholipid phosphatase
VTVHQEARSPRLRASEADWRRVAGRVDALDRAAYAAVTTTQTPRLDRQIARLSEWADCSGLWLVIATGLVLLGGRSGRRAAVRGLLSIGVTSTITNGMLKCIFRRRRPQRLASSRGRFVRMPKSDSFPSGHTASAFAFASAVAGYSPIFTYPIFALATAVGYSRVHTGMHYPGDVLGGALLGTVTGITVRAAFGKWQCQASG